MKEGWVLENIGGICQIVNGGTPKTNVNSYWDGEINWITPADLGKLTSKLVGSTKRKITQIGLEKSSAKLFPPYSIILSTRAPIGHLAINTAPMCTNQGCRGLVPNNKLDVWYLYYFLWNNVDLLNSLGSGTTFKELSTKALSNVRIPTPSLPEQQRIVSIIDEAFEAIDKAIENTQKNLQNAKELFESYLNNVFENGGEHWEKRKLIEICILINGRAYKKEELLSEGKYRVLRVGNFFTNNNWYHSDLELEENKYCEKGDLLYAWSASFGPRIWEKEKVIYHYHIWKVIPKNEFVSRDFLFILFNWDKEKIKAAQGTGTTMIHVSKGSMEDRVLPLPPLKEQNQIVAQLETIEVQTNQLLIKYQQKLRDLEELKKSILNKAFAGEL